MGLSKSMGAALFADKIFLREAYFIGMPLGGSPRPEVCQPLATSGSMLGRWPNFDL